MARTNREEDRRIINEREAFVAHLEPLVDGILQDDRPTYDAINALPPKTGVEVLMAVVDFAAIQRFGRTRREAARMVRNRKDGSTRVSDPVLERFGKRFKQVGIDDPEGYVQIAVKASETLLTAYSRDFTLWPDQQPNQG